MVVSRPRLLPATGPKLLAIETNSYLSRVANASSIPSPNKVECFYAKQLQETCSVLIKRAKIEQKHGGKRKKWLH